MSFYVRMRSSVAAGLVAALAVVFCPSVSRGSATTIALPDCVGKPEVKPKDVTIACGDANFRIEKIQWIGWGEAFAAGMGSGTLNDCEPYCAAGHFHNYPMVVIASGRQTCPNGQPAYAKVTYAFIGRSPLPASAQSVEDASMSFPCHART